MGVAVYAFGTTMFGKDRWLRKHDRLGMPYLLLQVWQNEGPGMAYLTKGLFHQGKIRSHSALRISRYAAVTL
jgi:hypothetical protein